jgi:hypothetical protein
MTYDKSSAAMQVSVGAQSAEPGLRVFTEAALKKVGPGAAAQRGG